VLPALDFPVNTNFQQVFCFHLDGLWFPSCHVKVEIRKGGVMQMAITFMAVVGGMIFSLAVALLTEELIFGQLFRLFFARVAVQPKTEEKS
jgi:hypothetical protein